MLVRHDSTEPGSPLAPTSPRHAFKPGIEGPHDLLVARHVDSAFYREPDLEAWLRSRRIERLVICGITTHHCCEATARMASNLGQHRRALE